MVCLLVVVVVVVVVDVVVEGVVVVVVEVGNVIGTRPDLLFLSWESAEMSQGGSLAARM